MSLDYSHVGDSRLSTDVQAGISSLPVPAAFLQSSPPGEALPTTPPRRKRGLESHAATEVDMNGAPRSSKRLFRVVSKEACEVTKGHYTPSPEAFPRRQKA